VSGTGYTVRIKTFMLLVAVTFHDDGKIYNVKGEMLSRRVRRF
jgi:hypothetical protein